MTIAESLPLLEIFWAHAARPEFTCRYRWSPNTVGVWDNCATQHYAINDYHASAATCSESQFMKRRARSGGPIRLPGRRRVAKPIVVRRPKWRVI